ncbi:uncharacterized protein [Oryza sativa Japonica Group]|uniref:uncharacterized protein n=1 Tax=Oryza sativa subsp. japonica TaxID=39947 RepID=UPI00339D19F1
MTLVVGYPNAPEHTTVPPLSGELPHRVRLEVHGYVGTCLANMVVEASGGTADHACQEAAYLMMARLRERHNYIFHDTAYRFHPRRASSDDVSTFRPTASENDTTFGHMCAVMRGLDRMHSDLHKASKALNDGKLMRIVALKDEIARLKREKAQLKGLPAPEGVRIRTTPHKTTTAPVRIQLAPRNPPPSATPAAPPVLPAAPMVYTRNGSRATGEGSNGEERTEGVHPNSNSDNGPPPLPENPTLAQVMAHQTQMMAAMMQQMQQQHQQMHQRMLQHAEQQHQQFGPPPPQSKLPEFLRLQGPASAWWDNHMATRPPGTEVTWAEFCHSFRKAQVPDGVVAQKKREFRALHQGNRTVTEYLHEFNHLARYAPEDVRTDAEKQEKFLAGLDDELTNQLISGDYADFERLVDKTIRQEDQRNKMDRKRKAAQFRAPQGSHQRPRFAPEQQGGPTTMIVRQYRPFNPSNFPQGASGSQNHHGGQPNRGAAPLPPMAPLPTQALTPAPASLRGFGGEAVQVLGQALLLIAFGSGENRREEQVLFDVVDIPYNYNAILGRATLNQFEAISHHNYLKLKIPGPAGVIVVKGLQPSATSKGDLAIINRAVHNVEAELHSRPKHAPKPTPHSKIVKVQIDDADPAKLISLGDGMGEQEAEGILAVLKKNIDIFAWSPDEVGVVSTDLIMHQLAIKPDAKPRKQKLCKMSADRQEAAKAEVQKLLRAGVIQEIDHPEWLANPVLVRKSNGKWRMCVDFTDLNKACPKDDFPLPRIDQLVDSTAGYELMSFLDAYSSYHQIHMNPPDIPKTAFITLLGIFCHLRMPFGLRNAGATFARLVYKVLYNQFGRNVEAYIDDIVVKSRKAFDHASDL